MLTRGSLQSLDIGHMYALHALVFLSEAAIYPLQHAFLPGWSMQAACGSFRVSCKQVSCLLAGIQCANAFQSKN